MTTVLRAFAAAALALGVVLTAGGCDTDVCQHHGGLDKAYVVDGTWYYRCNDGVTV